jgi:hypothetical protein
MPRPESNQCTRFRKPLPLRPLRWSHHLTATALRRVRPIEGALSATPVQHRPQRDLHQLAQLVVAGRSSSGAGSSLAVAAAQHAFVARLQPAVEADLATGPRDSLLARAVVQQGAFELAHGGLHLFHCLLCVEEGLVAAPESKRRSVVLRVARIAGRVAAVAPAELRSAIAAAAADPARGDVAMVLATDERRGAVRSWLENLVQLGARSVPTLSVELGAVVRVRLPEVADDHVWREAILGLTETLGAEWN